MVDHALTLGARNAERRHNLAQAMQTLGRRAEAVALERRVLAIDPSRENIRARLRHQILNMCDWSDHDTQLTATAALGTGETPVDPFTLLAVADAPRRQMLRSGAFAKAMLPAKPAPPPTARPLVGRRLRSHDLEALGIVILSHAPKSLARPDDDYLSPRDRVIDVATMSRLETVAPARSLALDVLVDLEGAPRAAASPFSPTAWRRCRSTT